MCHSDFFSVPLSSLEQETIVLWLFSLNHEFWWSQEIEITLKRKRRRDRPVKANLGSRLDKGELFFLVNNYNNCSASALFIVLPTFCSSSVYIFSWKFKWVLHLVYIKIKIFDQTLEDINFCICFVNRQAKCSHFGSSLKFLIKYAILKNKMIYWLFY